MKVLMVGGPADGRVADVPLGTPFIQYIMAPEPPEAVEEQLPPSFAPRPEAVVYPISQIILFNRVIYVAVSGSLSYENRCEAVARAMLSETGNLLRDAGEPLHKPRSSESPER